MTKPTHPALGEALRRLALAGTLTLAAGCAGDAPEVAPVAEGMTPEPGGTAVFAEAGDISKPMPLLGESSMDGDLGGDVLFMSLLRMGWEDGRVVYRTAQESPAALARSWEYVGPDSSALRFHLAPGRRWSDGVPITAHDVVWTYRMLGNPELAAPQQDYAAKLDSVVADDDDTVTFHFERRYPEMLFHAGLGISPRHTFAGTPPGQLRTHPALLDPAGKLPVSGPFRIGDWRKGERITLVRNEHFPVEPRLERIVIRVIPEPTTRLTELLTGKVDFMRPIPSDQVATIRAQAPNVRFERQEKRQYDFVGYNPKSFAPFADPEIREALGVAVNVPEMIRALQMEEWAVPAGGPYAPTFRDLYDERTMAPLAHDPERAKQILERKGWTDRDGDGIREKNGKPFRFTLLTNAGNPRRADVAQIVQQQWKNVGVDARIQMLEMNTFFSRQMEKDYEAVLGGWVIGLSPDITALWKSGSPFNIVSYDNPRTDSLMQQALAQPSEAKAAPYWKAAAAQIAADRPYSFLFYFDLAIAAQDRLRGMKVNTYGAYQNAWEWWIPRAEQRAAPARETTTAQN